VKKPFIILCAILAGCGKVGPLEPQAGKSLPPQAYAQNEKQSADRMFARSEQALPGRSDELLRRSDSRTEDPFDLPPGSTSSTGVPDKSSATSTTATVTVAPPK
jgi:predicted small lipoprotein YifL